MSLRLVPVDDIKRQLRHSHAKALLKSYKNNSLTLDHITPGLTTLYFHRRHSWHHLATDSVHLTTSAEVYLVNELKIMKRYQVVLFGYSKTDKIMRRKVMAEILSFWLDLIDEEISELE